MKYSRIFIITLILFFSSISFADKDDVNIRFNVGGLIPDPLLELIVDFQISEEWTIGPQLGARYLGITTLNDRVTEIQRTGEEFGVRANWHYNGFQSNGLYVGPSLSYSTIRVSKRSGPGANISNSENGFYFSGIVGYGWFWSSFNMLLGAGVQVALQSASVEYSDSNGNQYKYERPDFVIPIEFTLGWTF